MGNFIIAIILIAVLVLFTGINSFVICSVCDELLLLIDEEKIDEAKLLWEEKKDYLSLFVRDAEMDVVSAELNGAAEKISNEDGEAEFSLTDLKDAINELKHGEKPSFTNIFIIDRNV